MLHFTYEVAGLTFTGSSSTERIYESSCISSANCAYCHGQKIEGLSSTDKDSPNLTKRVATHSDGDFYWKIKNGRGERPSFAGDLEDDAIWEVIRYIRSQSEH